MRTFPLLLRSSSPSTFSPATSTFVIAGAWWLLILSHFVSTSSGFLHKRHAQSQQHHQQQYRHYHDIRTKNDHTIPTNSLIATTLTILTTSLFASENGHESNQQPETSQGNARPKKRIPVIGPFFNAPPLVVGGTQWLNSPTPLQWKTIEFCVDSMYGKKQSMLNATDASTASKSVKAPEGKTKDLPIATIDAAPLVAVLTPNSDIATLAAIVGIQRSDKKNENGGILDTTDSTSLQESLATLARESSSTSMYSENSRVRLLGVGRAKLTDFTTNTGPKMDALAKKNNKDVNNNNGGATTTPTSSSKTVTASKPVANNTVPGMGGAYWPINSSIQPQEGKNDKNGDEELENTETEDDEPIMMASMKVVLDGPVKAIKQNNWIYGKQSSPVHALNELSTWASRLSFLHKDRQKIVQGLRAAQARLDGASETWQDWDGIGTLFDSNKEKGDKKKNAQSSEEDLNDTLQEFLELHGAYDDFNPAFSASPIPLSDDALRVANLDNYGLGTTSSAYSDLQSLSRVLEEQLKPYYSPGKTETEEFGYCLVSWVALQSIQTYAADQPYRMKQLMECSNTIQRMEQLYDLMLAHKQALQELAKAKSRELRDCGEEFAIKKHVNATVAVAVAPVAVTVGSKNNKMDNNEQKKSPNVFTYTQELRNHVPSGKSVLDKDLMYVYNHTKELLELEQEKNLAEAKLANSTSSNSTSTIPPKPKVPVLAHAPNAPPLMIGETRILSPLTPLQWRTIMFSVDVLDENKKKSLSQHASTKPDDKVPNDIHDDSITNNSTMASVDAAPIVAILSPNSTVATLAAVVGLQKGKKNKKRKKYDGETSFEQEIANSFGDSSSYYSDSSKIRLLGIGRAELSEFTTQLRENIRGVGADMARERNMKKSVHEKHILPQDLVQLDDGDLVITASMKLVVDKATHFGASNDKDQQNNTKDDEYSDYISPVHALNKMSKWASQLSFLHKDRQRLVQGLQATQARIDALNGEDDRDEEEKKRHEKFMAAHYPKEVVNLSKEATRIEKLDNFGLGSTRTAFSDISSLSRVLKEQLEPYYSPSHTETEEHDYFLSSLAALQAVGTYLESDTMKELMALTNTVERMEKLYAIMMVHKDALEELSAAKKKEVTLLAAEAKKRRQMQRSRKKSLQKSMSLQHNQTGSSSSSVSRSSDVPIEKLPFTRRVERKNPAFLLHHNQTEGFPDSSGTVRNSTTSVLNSTDINIAKGRTTSGGGGSSNDNNQILSVERAKQGAEHHFREQKQLTGSKDNKPSPASAPRAGGGKADAMQKIPVIGPFLDAPPLLIGSTQWLRPPTPLQWKAIELCLDSRQDKNGLSSCVEGNITFSFATINAAPLVAIVTPGSEVATLAAIMGIRKTTHKKTNDDVESDSSSVGAGADSFHEYIAERYRRSSPYYSDRGEVRLLGIGRAKLSDFTTFLREKGPSEPVDDQEDDKTKEGDKAKEDNSGNIRGCKGSRGDDVEMNGNENSEECGIPNDCVTEQEEEEDIEKELQGNIDLVMVANMKVVLDGAELGEVDNTEFTERSSSIHAVNRMSRWASKLSFLHQERQKLVRGLQATKTPMEVARLTKSTANPDKPTPVLSAEALRLEELDNYGLGTTRSAFSDLRSLAGVLKEQLRPYYSKSLAETEEFDYALLSWVALHSLDTYLERGAVNEIMETVNTVERMKLLYTVMMEHKDALKEHMTLRKHVLGDVVLEEKDSGDKPPPDKEMDPVTIANMKVILDAPILEFYTEEYTKRSSPVHAVIKLSKWASRLRFLHKDRQKIVQGLQAAQARIEGASQKWEDLDGIGDIFKKVKGKSTTKTGASKGKAGDFLARSSDGVTFSLPLSEEARRVTKLDNFGLGSASSAYGDLQSLANELKEQLKPYYSPARLKAEEFDYCLITWVALQSLQPYLEENVLDDVMKMRNALERMERLHDIMTAHKKTLQELAEVKCQELKDCGETSKGLF